MSRKHLPWVLLVLLAVVPLGFSLAWTNRNRPASTILLTAEDVRLARELAERDLDIVSHPATPAEQTYYIKVDFLPASQAESDQRLVVVHHYRYREDETILTIVDLNRHEVIRRERAYHFPTALNSAEICRAKELVQSDGQLQSLISSRSLQVDCRPTQVRTDDPRFGHRLVMVMLREDGDYLESPLVLVDLHTENVQITN